MGADARAGLFGTPSPGPHTTATAACCGLPTFCTAAMSGVTYPGKVCITLDDRVMTIDKNDLVIFQLAVLTNPVPN